MSDADCLLETLTQILHRYTQAAGEALKLRSSDDPETLEVIRERCLRWALDLRHRGTVCRFWEQISHALRDVSSKRIHWEDLPESIWLKVNEPPRGRFVRPQEESDAIELANMLASLGRSKIQGRGWSPPGHAARIENPHRMRIEGRSNDSE